MKALCLVFPTQGQPFKRISSKSPFLVVWPSCDGWPVIGILQTPWQIRNQNVANPWTTFLRSESGCWSSIPTSSSHLARRMPITALQLNKCNSGMGRRTQKNFVVMQLIKLHPVVQVWVLHLHRHHLVQNRGPSCDTNPVPHHDKMDLSVLHWFVSHRWHLQWIVHLSHSVFWKRCKQFEKFLDRTSLGTWIFIKLPALVAERRLDPWPCSLCDSVVAMLSKDTGDHSFPSWDGS